VWLEGEVSDTWHPSWGGGLWIGLLSRANAIALTIAKSDERTAFYVRAGFSFSILGGAAPHPPDPPSATRE
jgi:hypothetical protein